MIRDLYDNSIVAYKTGTEQTVNLVLGLCVRRKRGPLRSSTSCLVWIYEISVLFTYFFSVLSYRVIFLLSLGFSLLLTLT